MAGHDASHPVSFCAGTRRPTGYLPAETARRSTITQIRERTNQAQRMVMAASFACFANAKNSLDSRCQS
jgi:hypothetical protein